MSTKYESLVKAAVERCSQLQPSIEDLGFAAERSLLHGGPARHALYLLVDRVSVGYSTMMENLQELQKLLEEEE